MSPRQTYSAIPPVEDLIVRWEALRAGAASWSDAATVATTKDLARQLVTRRNTLFEANARLQADASSDDDAAMVGQLEANQDAIKACTTALSEMTQALGRASIPA